MVCEFLQNMSVTVNLEPGQTKSTNTDTLVATSTMDDMNRAYKVSTEETVKALKRKYKSQAMYWQKAFKDQVLRMQKFQKEKNEELSLLSSQLLMFEANLRQRNRSLTDLITEKDEMITKQNHIIHTLTEHLKKANSVAIHETIRSHRAVTSISADSGIADVDNSHTMSISESMKGGHPTEVVSKTPASPKYSSIKKSWKFIQNLKSPYVRSISEDATMEHFDYPKEAEGIDRFPKNNIRENCDVLGGNVSSKVIRRKTISTGDLDFNSRSKFNMENERDCPVKGVKSVETNDCNMYDRVMASNRSFRKTGEGKFQRINRSTSKHLEKICHIMFDKS